MKPESNHATTIRSSLRARLGSGSLWNLLGASFSQGSTFLVGLLAARTLSRDSFGAFGALMTTMTATAGIASLGAGFTATKFIAALRHTDPNRARRVMTLCLGLSTIAALIASIILLAAAPAISAKVFHRSDLSVLLIPVAGSAFLSVVSGTQTGVLAGFEEFSAIAWVGVVRGFVYGIACAVGLRWFGLFGLVIGVLLACAVQFGMLAWRLARVAGGTRFSFSWDKLRQELGWIRGFALPAALPGLTTMPALWVGSALLLQRGDGFAELALFAAANSIRTLVLFVPNLIAGVSLSLMNSELGRGNLRAYRETVWLTLRVATSIAAVGVAVGAVGSGRLMRMFGRSFGEGKWVLVVLLAAVIPEVFGVVCSHVLASKERMWASLVYVALPRDVLFVVLTLFLSHSWGAIGMAGGFLLSTVYAAGAGVTLIFRSGFQNKAVKSGYDAA